GIEREIRSQEEVSVGLVVIVALRKTQSQATTRGMSAYDYLLLAPYLAFNAPTTRPNSGGWATPYTGRIIGLILLNNVGITALNRLPAVDFDMPPEFKTGTETLSYTYRLNTGYVPQNYEVALEAIDVPLLLVAGDADEAFFADQYESTIIAYTEADVVILPDVSHMGAVVDDDVQIPIIEWLQNLE
ncbi:MAG: hypothetical protein AAFV93_14765, partial [Chloroflexota bacterium]